VTGRSTGDLAPDARGALDALTDAIAAGRALGLEVGPAESVSQEAEERLGIVADAYVVALIGGTGVGKSTILNALAGANVSEASARRPTTSAPIAWVSAHALDSVRPLLARLGAATAKTHSRADLDRVVVLDLPDVDSLEAGHRSIVEAVLPKVDVVAWVTDPEKYADAVLHDRFLGDWLGRLDRQIVVLNKADRLDVAARREVERDLRRLLSREVTRGAAPTVISTFATEGEAGIASLRSWLANAAEAKAVVAARLIAGARAAIAELATAAGVTLGDGRLLVSQAEQERAVGAAIEEVLRVVDLPGTERQAIAATRARARRRGTGPIGLLTSLVYRASGRQRRAADPAGYLRAWPQRGGLTRASEQVRRVISDALPGVPPALRGPYAAAGDARDLEQRFKETIDRVVARQAAQEPPTSRVWPVIGLLQTANTLLLIFAVAWVVLWVIARPQVASYDLPVLGPVPAPMVLLFVALALGYILARALGLHAGWLGRRWARRLSSEIRKAITEVISAQAIAPLERLERARELLGEALRGAARPTSGS
jgi:GTP-binding protein EngB required for normal cell division